MRPGQATMKHRGSVILMVIGLLTIVAMLGTTLLLVARLDQKTSRAVASAAPAMAAAQGVLDQLRADRAVDLHIGGGYVYGAIATPEDAIDYPDEGADKALATIERDASGKWRHMSNLANFLSTNVTDVDPANPPVAIASLLADADGDGVGDSLLFDTGVQDPEGGHFQAAVRMIDTSGLMNLNTADQTRPADPAWCMDARDVSVKQLFLDIDPANGGTAYTNITTARNPHPFDFGDLIAIAVNLAPVRTGRAYTALNPCLPALHYLTTKSTGRRLTPTYKVAPASGDQLDINTANLNDLYNQFSAMLQAAGDPAWSAKAAQMAVNVADYRDADFNVTDYVPPTLPGMHFYGNERHLYITKIYCELANDSGGVLKVDRPISAIEMINPYSFPLDVSYYRCGPAGSPWCTLRAVANLFVQPQQRIVVRTKNIVGVAPGTETVDDPSLNLTAAVNIMAPISVPGSQLICIDTAPGLAVTVPTTPSEYHWTVGFRDDVLDHAAYTIFAYAPASDNPADDYVDDIPPPGAPTMGTPNRTAPNPPTCPVYLRNGNFVNVGELLRILTVGPDTIQSLSEKLVGWPPLEDVGRLQVTRSVAAAANPALPAGCLISEFFQVGTFGVAQSVFDGLININTAPPSVLRCLPALAAMEMSNPLIRSNIVKEIITYRDSDPLVRPAIPNLRNKRGFATAGEVMIPIWAAKNTENNYAPANASPLNYTFNGDDGLVIPYPQNDPDKNCTYYKWLSNQITVRSDTYLAYILVRPPGAGQRDRRFVALIDRSNCNTAGALPAVLMMAEIK